MDESGLKERLPILRLLHVSIIYMARWDQIGLVEFGTPVKLGGLALGLAAW